MPTLQARVDDVVMSETAKGPIYKAKINGVEYATFNKEIANQAKALKGQTATVDFTISQNGQWTNHYLEGITAAQLGLGIPAETNGFHSTPPVEPAPTSADRETRIMRQTALKCAVATLPFFPAAEQSQETIAVLCDTYLSYFQYGWDAEFTNPAPVAEDDIPF